MMIRVQSFRLSGAPSKISHSEKLLNLPKNIHFNGIVYEISGENM